MHELVPAEAAYVFAAHVLQELELAGEYWPTAHEPEMATRPDPAQ